MVYRRCVRSAMLHGSKTWCLRENEIAILTIKNKIPLFLNTVCEFPFAERSRVNGSQMYLRVAH